MTAKKQTVEPSQMHGSFAERMTALEAIVQQMESGSLPLEQALEAYAQGSALLQACQADLQRAEHSVLILNQQQLTPFNPEQ